MSNVNNGPSAAVSNNMQAGLQAHIATGVTTFANLPPASRHGPEGTNYQTAWTSDQGLVYSNGTSWVGLATASNTPFNPSAAGLPAGVGAALGLTSVQMLGERMEFVLNVCSSTYGATGNGTTDDAAAIQAAITAAATLHFPLYFPAGTYRVNSDLIIPSDVELRGTGLDFSSVIAPNGCRGIVIDGALIGGFRQRIKLKYLQMDLTNATVAASNGGLHINKAYTIDVEFIRIYNAGTASVENGIWVKDSNNIRMEMPVVWAATGFTSTKTGIRIDSSSVKLVQADVEGFQGVGGKGIVCTGSNSWVDLDSPYSEQCNTNISHEITSGQTNIYGGQLLGGTSAAQQLRIAAGNIAVYGTRMPPGSAVAAVNVTGTAFRKITLNSVFGGWDSSLTAFFNSGADLSGVTLTSPPIAYVMDNRTYFYKTGVATATATDILTIGDFASSVKCKLVVMGALQNTGQASYEFHFTIGSNTLATGLGGDAHAVVTVTTGAWSNGNWAIAIAAPTLTVVGNTVKVTLTPTLTGALGAGSSCVMYGYLEILAYDPSAGAHVNVL